MPITAFRAFNSGLPITPLKAKGHSIARNSITAVDTQGRSPSVIASLMVPLGIT